MVKFSLKTNLIVGLGLFLFLTQQVQAQTEAVPGEYIIKYRSNGQLQNVRSKLQGKANLKKVLSEGSFYHVSMKSDQLAAIQSDADVEYIEPNYYLSKFDDVSGLSSTSYTQSSAATQVYQSWSIAAPYAANNRPIVAIIDTGVDPTHHVFTNSNAIWVNPGEIAANGIDDDFNGYIDDVSGWNFITNTKTYNDDEGHGTHVGGIVVGASLDIKSGSIDQSRIRIMPLKFLDSKGSGSTSNAIAAIYYAVNNGAKVINCSWGGGTYSQALHEALAYAYSHQVVVVTAAGNNASNNDVTSMYPANYDVPSLISVAATDDSDYMASFSNYGASLVHVASPGVNIYSTYPGNTYAYMSGTSMAAPFVAGIAAMALREAPSVTGYQIKNMILSSVDLIPSTLTNKVSTKGRVNDYKLIQLAKSSASTLASQPDYSPNYKADRSTASSVSASSAGGCGLVKGLTSTGGGSGPFSSGGALGFTLMALIPLALWLGLRMKVKAPNHGRKYDRFKINSQIKVQIGDKELVADMKTISMGGLSFNAETALEKGGLVTMKIASPDGQEQIEVEGRVVWSENNQSYGVQFSDAKTGALAAISDWTKNLSKAS